MINCAAFTNVDGAETQADVAHAVNGVGAGNVARGRRRRRGVDDPRLDRLRVRRAQARALRGVRPGLAPVGLRAARSSKASGPWPQAAPGSHTIVRSSWLFGAAGPCFPATILRLAGERDSAERGRRSGRLPDVHRPPARARWSLLAGERRLAGIVHVAGGGQCSWFEFAQEIVGRGRAGVRGAAGRDGRPGVAPRRAPPTACSAPNVAATCHDCRTGRTGWRSS